MVLADYQSVKSDHHQQSSQWERWGCTESATTLNFPNERMRNTAGMSMGKMDDFIFHTVNCQYCFRSHLQSEEIIGRAKGRLRSITKPDTVKGRVSNSELLNRVWKTLSDARWGQGDLSMRPFPPLSFLLPPSQVQSYGRRSSVDFSNVIRP